jgi:hypothetical protein
MRRKRRGLVAAGTCLRAGIFTNSCIYFFPFGTKLSIITVVTVETFSQEIAAAMKVYDKYIVCLDKTPEEFQTTLISLLQKAIKAYENRGPQLRHGIALDKQVTVILSQSDDPRPLCGIYFNLHSPYQKEASARAPKAVSEPIGGQAKSEV